jgi:hypothetical protein
LEASWRVGGGTSGFSYVGVSDSLEASDCK